MSDAEPTLEVLETEPEAAFDASGTSRALELVERLAMAGRKAGVAWPRPVGRIRRVS